ncbi:type II secretion system protein [Gemmatimonas groenlandica]|uniref:Type II secretion system protein n=1 Tax=Gemmatimonas groenlandica TaxID=2732249 RepID=A0A6M4ITZ5_9BACT|nr:type II secretion system protein [Gemmatimonas groenlandica]QJR36322.1 type II secretion system protein [Gemmatimonas groenlandica]
MMRLTRPRRRGFTLIELLITMTILGLLGTMVTAVMVGQQRFFQRTTQQMDVRRELRTAVNVMSAELRSVSSAAGDIVAFDRMSITFRDVLGSSVVCATPTRAQVDLVPTTASRMQLSNFASDPSVGDTVVVLRNDSSGVAGEYWSAHRITSVSSSAVTCPLSPYVDALLDVGKSRLRLGVTPNLPDSVVAGAPLRLLRTTRYALSTQSSGAWYLGRSEYAGGAWTAAVPVAGPFQAANASGAGGLGLAMYDSVGVAVTAIASSNRIARIDVVARASGESSSGKMGSSSTAITDSLLVSVALRNRR